MKRYIVSCFAVMASFVLPCHTNSYSEMQKNIDKPVAFMVPTRPPGVQSDGVAFMVPVHHPGGDVNGVVC